VQLSGVLRPKLTILGIRISACFRVSAFGLRISGRQNMIFPQLAGL
jgi:hypothetical protein